MLANDSFDLFNELNLENATREEVVWLSDNTKAVRLSGSVAKAVVEGESTIIAKVKNTTRQTSMKILVRDQVLKFTQEELAIVTGKDFDLNQVLEVKNVGLGELVWTSADSRILTVDRGKYWNIKKVSLESW